jgi:hypothetical protein
MKLKLGVSVISLLMMMALFSLPIVAQETTGNITGTVRDQSGGVIPGATVTITNQGTDEKQTTTTDAAGVYRFEELRPGRYTVGFQATGFSSGQLQDIQVLVGRTAQVDVKMQVSGITQTLTVTSTPIIDTSTTMVALNIPSEEFDHLPKGRSFQDLAAFQTSVNTGEIEAGYQVNGASAAENNFYIDGVSTTSVINGSARQNATLEYVQEVQVKTTGLEAEYGGALGGVVSAVTKSGGNEFHGEVHYYYYGNRINAGPTKRLQLDPVDDETVYYVQDQKMQNDFHEFGATLSGPIVKDKLWFFTSLAPQWNKSSYGYRFDNGETSDTLKRDAHKMSWFNKLSYDPTDRIRTNFTFLYTPQYRTGSLPVYDGIEPNVSTYSKEDASGLRTRGYNQPENSWTGSIDFTLSNSSLLSVKGGRYFLNYKEVGVPYTEYYRWRSSSVGIPGVPEDLQLGAGYSTPSAGVVLHDTATRTYVQADYSQFVRFAGQHNFKFGVGVQKNISSVEDRWMGINGRVNFYWDQTPSFNDTTGTYGFYSVEDGRTIGSAGATITHIYLQDSWRIHPRLTLNVGLRTEREVIPSYNEAVAQEILGTKYAFKFGFGDKLAPRLGASFDVFGDGKLKVYGGWGRYFDWTKYDLSRGTFGADFWLIYYRTLDQEALDNLFDINLNYMPGTNLWPYGEARDYRWDGHAYLDTNLKPMSSDLINFGVDYEIVPQIVFSARYTRNKLNRTIEDMGVLVNGNEEYRYGNPGEGANTIAPSVSGLTCLVDEPGVCGFPMPKAQRIYNAMELSLSRRFSGGWLANVSYVYSDLWGNYTGLQSTDEIRPPTLGYGFGTNQLFGATDWRPGGNVNRYWDLDEAMWDAHGNLGLLGPLPTDRPHVFKLYGSKQFSFGTDIGIFFRAMSGTPVTTQVVTVSPIPVYVEGRGNLGRTPVFSQTDLLLAHEINVGENQKVRFEFNFENLFNQKTSVFVFDRYNREERYDSAGIYLYDKDLSKGFDWKQLVLDSPEGAGALDPRYQKDAIFNPGFHGRFMIKFIF